MGKYDPWRDHLRRQTADTVAMTFDQLNELVTLPKSAKTYEWWWVNQDVDRTTQVQCKSWQAAGYNAAVDLGRQLVTFRKRSFEKRLHRIEQLEEEILRKASGLMQGGRSLYHSDFFVLGATKRVLSLASGFRMLMAARNFTSCAGLLRMQIDTAARVNALMLVDDMNGLCEAVLSGIRLDKQKDREGQFLRDSRLISKLAEKFPWVENVYKETSGFIHLSERHIFSSIAKTDDAKMTVQFSISAQDPKRPDEAYFEILDCFFEATKMAGTLTVGYIQYRSLIEAKRGG